MKFETMAVHAADPDATTGDVAPPIHFATTFARDPGLVLIGDVQYAREGGPTHALLEAALARLDGGERAIVFSSGMAAGTSILQSLGSGDRVLLPDDAYYGFHVAGRDYLNRWGIETETVDMSDLSALARALDRPARIVWLESPSNPLLKVVDLAGAIALAKRAGAVTVVDNTFATPALQSPLALGADVTLQSATKYLGGHSDVMGGVLVFARRDDFAEQVAHARHILGAIANPFASWLVLRGVRTLALRMERHSANALAVARALERHPRVKAVHYPGLPSHPGHEIAARQMRAFGGMLSFRAAGGRDAAIAAVGRSRLFVRATSLGSVESLIEHRQTSEGKGSKAPPELIRLSVGLEHPDDLIADLQQALQ
ncbi:MAG TPA: PLP-dependent transferase [Candidatus Polarisedimenticolaceae bacterium]|nr:PLP-dependent transferase [Candidatus Polarisedimenticolaceae bacterium]